MSQDPHQQNLSNQPGQDWVYFLAGFLQAVQWPQCLGESVQKGPFFFGGGVLKFMAKIIMAPSEKKISNKPNQATGI